MKFRGISQRKRQGRPLLRERPALRKIVRNCAPLIVAAVDTDTAGHADYWAWELFNSMVHYDMADLEDVASKAWGPFENQKLNVLVLGWADGSVDTTLYDQDDTPPAQLQPPTTAEKDAILDFLAAGGTVILCASGANQMYWNSGGTIPPPPAPPPPPADTEITTTSVCDSTVTAWNDFLADLGSETTIVPNQSLRANNMVGEFFPDEIPGAHICNPDSPAAGTYLRTHLNELVQMTQADEDRLGNTPTMIPSFPYLVSRRDGKGLCYLRNPTAASALSWSVVADTYTNATPSGYTATVFGPYNYNTSGTVDPPVYYENEAKVLTATAEEINGGLLVVLNQRSGAGTEYTWIVQNLAKRLYSSKCRIPSLAYQTRLTGDAPTASPYRTNGGARSMVSTTNPTQIAADYWYTDNALDYFARNSQHIFMETPTLGGGADPGDYLVFIQWRHLYSPAQYPWNKTGYYYDQTPFHHIEYAEATLAAQGFFSAGWLNSGAGTYYAGFWFKDAADTRLARSVGPMTVSGLYALPSIERWQISPFTKIDEKLSDLPVRLVVFQDGDHFFGRPTLGKIEHSYTGGGFTAYSHRHGLISPSGEGVARMKGWDIINSQAEYAAGNWPTGSPDFSETGKPFCIGWAVDLNGLEEDHNTASTNKRYQIRIASPSSVSELWPDAGLAYDPGDMADCYNEQYSGLTTL